MSMYPLSRYLRVVDGSAPPRYLVARSIGARMPPPMRRSWEEHTAAVGQVRELLEDEVHLVSPSLMDLKVELARPHMKSCSICPWRCGVDRTASRGRCGVTRPLVSSAFVHMGEEAPLIPSFTVFFAGCNLDCAFCQNYDLSTMPDRGERPSAEKMASALDAVVCSGRGIRNVNWVGGDPIPALPYVLEVLSLMEAHIAQIWNSNMYLEESSMRLLDGAIDVYLTDLKFGNDECAKRLCGAHDYSSVVRRNHRMAAEQGEVLVRHLQLPGHLECCTVPIIDFLADHLPGAALNLMDQYRPEHRAYEHPELRTPLPERERREAMEYALSRGLHIL